LIALVVGAPVFEALAQSGNLNTARRGAGPRKQLATIIFSGLGGAVLGLSTLSFYGRPQDNLNNIAVGFAVGVIVGTGYVTYTALTNPSEFYGDFRSDDLMPLDSLMVQLQTENDPSVAHLWAANSPVAQRPMGAVLPGPLLTWNF
jgi:hypothetical protein